MTVSSRTSKQDIKKKMRELRQWDFARPRISLLRAVEGMLLLVPHHGHAYLEWRSGAIPSGHLLARCPPLLLHSRPVHRVQVCCLSTGLIPVRRTLLLLMSVIRAHTHTHTHTHTHLLAQRDRTDHSLGVRPQLWGVATLNPKPQTLQRPQRSEQQQQSTGQNGCGTATINAGCGHRRKEQRHQGVGVSRTGRNGARNALRI
jgi:hypothetical protein